MKKFRARARMLLPIKNIETLWLIGCARRGETDFDKE
jgi:hypothetical protein